MVNRKYVGEESRSKQDNFLVQIDTAITDANNRLNSNGKAKLLIDRKNKRLYLRGTLPVIEDPNSTKRYWIPFGETTIQGVIDAENKCREVDSYLKYGGKEWWLLLPDYQKKKVEQVKPQVMSEIKETFTEAYWKTREKSRKTLSTWEKSYTDIFLKIPDDQLLTESNISNWIDSTQPNSKPRADLIRVIKCLADHVGIKDDIDWKQFRCKYQPKKRTLPTDGYIEATFNSMPRQVAWTFGMIATYGLRPSELFLLTEDCYTKFTSESNYRNVLHISDDTKTGERIVYPIHPEWVDKFELLDVMPFVTAATKLENIISILNQAFQRHGFNQPAYNLRHRYAIRASELGIAVDIAAKWMGHSVEEHTKTYQKWMDHTTHNKAFDKMLDVKSEISELDKLRIENQYLRNEVQRLKKLIT